MKAVLYLMLSGCDRLFCPLFSKLDFKQISRCQGIAVDFSSFTLAIENGVRDILPMPWDNPGRSSLFSLDTLYGSGLIRVSVAHHYDTGMTLRNNLINMNSVDSLDRFEQ